MPKGMYRKKPVASTLEFAAFIGAMAISFLGAYAHCCPNGGEKASMAPMKGVAWRKEGRRFC